MSYRTLARAIVDAAENYPQNGFTFQALNGDETFFSFPEIEAESRRRAKALQDLGLEKGDRIGLIVVEPQDFVLTYLAAARAGIVTVPLYPPLSLGALDAYHEKTTKVLSAAGARFLVASSSLQNVVWSLVDKVPTLERLVQVEKLAGASGEPELPEITDDDVAFLQYTSGSTADPKGVIVTHGNLAANSEGVIAAGLELSPDTDVGVSWLPLYHDMGLIGFVVAPIYRAVSVVFIPTVRFLKRNSVWLDTIHRHRGTITFAPPFAYGLAMRRAERYFGTWDLSCLKVMGCGAEPIPPALIREFTELFHENCGLEKDVVLPAYGMAEATLAITFKPLHTEFKDHFVDAAIFGEEGEVAPAEGEAPSLHHVSCGTPFEGHSVEIRDEAGQVLPEGREGQICVKGPSVVPGYFQNEEATKAAFQDGWLYTGDLGYLHEGELYVTGRVKDLLIINGRNIHPQAIEWAVSDVDGVRKGNVVAFSRPGESTEEIVLVLETRKKDHEAIVQDVHKAVQHELGVRVADVVCLEPGLLPKTSSGKLQRRKARAQYLAARLGKEGSRIPGSAGKMKLARHMAQGLVTRAKTAVGR